MTTVNTNDEVDQALATIKMAGTMKPDVKQAWLQALRSGDYAQTRRFLHDRTGYCCLGVLADLQGVQWHSRGSFYYDINGGGSTTMLPTSMSDEVGLTCESQPGDGRPLGDVPSALAMLNDAGWSFEQIADVIEEYL